MPSVWQCTYKWRRSFAPMAKKVIVKYLLQHEIALKEFKKEPERPTRPRDDEADVDSGTYPFMFQTSKKVSGQDPEYSGMFKNPMIINTLAFAHLSPLAFLPANSRTNLLPKAALCLAVVAERLLKVSLRIPGSALAIGKLPLVKTWS
ncbi:hypothetical protein EWM64_g10832 [Hericium alpestre]|uniref:Uncharacterized protein n=1 Tax=Hericium alpestre TaxID=135208 RepID=A0A4Y9ZG86_9AGAM|nr:hypothetical protein EWM64_g10832 [Hericium alpestre]